MRYYFHLECDPNYCLDARGEIFALESDAVDHAHAIARDLACDNSWAGWSVRIVGPNNSDVAIVPVPARSYQADARTG